MVATIRRMKRKVKNSYLCWVRLRSMRIQGKLYFSTKTVLYSLPFPTIGSCYVYNEQVLKETQKKETWTPLHFVTFALQTKQRAQENKSASVRHSLETPEVPGRCWATATKQGRPLGPYTREPQASTVLVLPTTGKGLCTSPGSQEWENMVNTAKMQTEKGQSWLSFHIRNNLTLKIKKPNDYNTALCSTSFNPYSSDKQILSLCPWES